MKPFRGSGLAAPAPIWIQWADVTEQRKGCRGATGAAKAGT